MCVGCVWVFLGRPCKCREGGTLTLDCPVHYKGEIPLVKYTCVYCMWKSTCSLCGMLHMESVVCSVLSQWCAPYGVSGVLRIESVVCSVWSQWCAPYGVSGVRTVSM